MIRFRVFVPNAPGRWAVYQARWWQVVPIWLLFALRGLRALLWAPPAGRLVTLPELLAAHPPRAARCLCRGTGIVTSWRRDLQGVSFCGRMLADFRRRFAFRCSDSPQGPRWIAGQAPEDMAAPLACPESVQARRHAAAP